MSDEISIKSKLSWTKSLVKKWFNIKNKAQDFHADDVIYGGYNEDWGNKYSERETCTIRKSKSEQTYRKSSSRARRSNNINLEAAHVTDVHNYRIYVSTWNVAGKSPSSHLNLEDWLHTSPPADIYVLGFQEIVPLNAGNVLGNEDNGPAKKWLSLIRTTLNNLPSTISGNHTPSPNPNPIVELAADFEGSTIQKASSLFHRQSFQSLSRSVRMDDDVAVSHSRLDRRYSVCDRVICPNRASDYDPNYKWCSSDDENPSESLEVSHCSPLSYCDGSYFEDESERQRGKSRYCLVASKQMVGIYLTIWARNDLRDDIRNLKVSCIGRGLMGYLGNKGSISISMSLHQTSFCFVCSHLTSGQKEGDELRRNSDVMEILKKTRFPNNTNSPRTIMDHDRVIWLGDLNYRIALSYRSVKALVEMRNWKALLENDQLRIEQRRGRVFEGWNEGKIYFPPTYKYSKNSDRYAGADTHHKQKQRTPAWCDRILWYGRGLSQLSYIRGESRFSDHRPVYGLFLAEVEFINRGRIKKSSSFSSARIEVEELLPHSHGYS